MSQDSIAISEDPPLPGLALVQAANGAFQSIASDFAGTTDPASVGGVGAYMTWADTANGVIKRRNDANTAWVVVGRIFQEPLPKYDSGSIPTADIGPIYVTPFGWMEWNSTAGFYISIGCGRVEYFMTDKVPTGYIKANAPTVSRTTYKGLFYLMGTTYGAGDGSTTFVAGQDMRGEFPRGWDDGRGVDSGRGLASAQSDQNAAHRHNLLNIDTTGVTTGAAGGIASGSLTIVFGQPGVPFDGGYSGIVSGSAGGSEARPRNVALMACLKY